MHRLVGYAAALGLSLAAVGAGAESLSIGVPGEPTSIDPHYQELGPNLQIRQHIFDCLVHIGPREELLPGLATSWKATADPLVWEFTLRQGVKFHDGTQFTARDVVFSLARAPDVPNAPSTFKRHLQDVAEVIAVDDATVRIRTKRPSPILPNDLATIAIVSGRLARDVPPTAFNSGAAAIGTGPYKFVDFVPGNRVTLAANPDYWGGAPKWDKVTFRLFSNGSSRLAALLAGDVDLIADVPTSDIGWLEKDPRAVISAGPSDRVIFWTVDVFRETTPFITDKQGRAIANPLRDRRVRQAFNLAIDRKALVERIMEGRAIAASQIPPEGFPGYDRDIGIPTADPARARALLAEAGYPDGFKMTIHTTNDRYVNDARMAQAVAAMLGRIGVEVTVTAIPVALYYGPARKHEFTMMQVGWGHNTGDTIVIMREALRSGALNNYGLWSSPAVDALLDRAQEQMDLKQRSGMLAEVSRIAAGDVALLPTHYQVNIWASRKGLRYVPRMDEMTLAMSVVKDE